FFFFYNSKLSANPNMRLNFSKLKKFFKKNLSIFITYLSILGIILVWNIIYVQAKIYTDIQQAELDYDHEVELEYGAEVRGKRVDEEKHEFATCLICGKPAGCTVYIAKSY
ncbi:unnamed protein product, partial [marine sediment metagenome]